MCNNINKSLNDVSKMLTSILVVASTLLPHDNPDDVSCLAFFFVFIVRNITAFFVFWLSGWGNERVDI